MYVLFLCLGAWTDAPVTPTRNAKVMDNKQATLICYSSAEVINIYTNKLKG